MSPGHNGGRRAERGPDSLAVKPPSRSSRGMAWTEVIVTGWSDSRIPWPRCRQFDARGGGSGLLVDAELARAVRSESRSAPSAGRGS
jgi:hypothetical protein